MTAIGKTLLFGGAATAVALVWCSNTGSLPPEAGDFMFFLLVAVLGALYRPGWIFLLLVLSLPLETMNLAPTSIGFDLRPYQFLGLSLFLGLLARFFASRALPEMPKILLTDMLLALLPIGSVLSSVNAPMPSASLKLSLILCSFFGLYILSRIYVRSTDDIRKILPFVLVSGAIVIAYSIFQNVRFLAEENPFQVMPGRPDGGFPEPDWLGMYLVFFGSLLLVLLTKSFFESPAISGKNRFFWVGFLSLIPVFMVLLMTVSRSAWLGMAISGAVTVAVFAYVRRSVSPVGTYTGGIVAVFLLALFLVQSVPFTRFDLFGRAASTGGFQEITVSCDAGSILSTILPERIADISELGSYNCRHIDLEDREEQVALGNFVTTVSRPDPNVEIRKSIYGVSWEKIKEHPILGIGWGSIGAYLGRDGRGASLNASNVFLETWLGSGLVGLVGLVGFLGVIIAGAVRRLRTVRTDDPKTGYSDVAPPLFVLSVVPGLLVFDLFNSGSLLGFLWVLFASFSAISRRNPVD